MPKEWRTFIITMDQTSERFKSFQANNNHIDFEIFKGINGKNLDFKKLINDSLITEELSTSPLFTKGTAGCAESHRSLWLKSINENISLIVVEDDCYTHPSLEHFINKRWQTLNSIDICLFGVNTDVDFHSVSPQGLTSITNFFPKHPKEKWIQNAFKKNQSWICWVS